MNKELQREQQRDEEEALEAERLRLERQLKQARALAPLVAKLGSLRYTFARVCGW